MTDLNLATVADLKAHLKVFNDSLPLEVVLANGEVMAHATISVVGGAVRLDLRRAAMPSIPEQMDVLNAADVEGAPV